MTGGLTVQMFWDENYKEFTGECRCGGLWAGHLRTLQPVRYLEETAAKFPLHQDRQGQDVPGCREIKKAHTFETHPTTHFFAQGKLLLTREGVVEPAELAALISDHLLTFPNDPLSATQLPSIRRRDMTAPSVPSIPLPDADTRYNRRNRLLSEWNDWISLQPIRTHFPLSYVFTGLLWLMIPEASSGYDTRRLFRQPDLPRAITINSSKSSRWSSLSRRRVRHGEDRGQTTSSRYTASPLRRSIWMRRK